MPTADRGPGATELNGIAESPIRVFAVHRSVRAGGPRTNTPMRSNTRMDRARYGPGVDGGLDDIERWFVARGLPHFVERRDSVWEIWGRAAPLLAVAYLLLGLYALDLSEWSLTENLVAAVAIVGAAVLTWVDRQRDAPAALVRPPARDRPRRAGRVHRRAGGRLARRRPAAATPLKTVIIAIAFLALLWALTSYGVPALLGWAWQRTWSQLSTLLNVLARALPMLLLFSAFLFINAEAWQVAGTLTGVVYVAVLGIFFLLGATFVLIRIPALMRSLNQFDSWREVAELAASTPAAAVLDALAEPTDDDDPHAERPTIRQRVNIGLLTIFSQAIQITLVGLGLTGFFVLFGFLAIPEATTLVVDRARPTSTCSSAGTSPTATS